MSSSGPPSPEISVVMSVYNGMPLLAEAAESILDQSFENFEFIVINDGSSDGSLDYLEAKAAEDRRIRIIDQKNTGLTRALIRGCAEARAPVIARMDADDVSMPGRLAAQIAVLRANPDYVGVSCGIEYIADNPDFAGHDNQSRDILATPLLMAFYNCLNGHGHMMFRRDAYVEAGGYDASFRYAQDYDLWNRLLRLGPIGNAEGFHYRFRRGHESISIRNAGEQRALSARTALREQERLAPGMSDEPTADLLFDLWFARAVGTVSKAALLRADRLMHRAFSNHFGGAHEHWESAAAVRRSIAELWIEAGQRSRRVRVAVLMLASRWDWRHVLTYLRQTLQARLARRFGRTKSTDLGVI